jgi:phosphatidate cytidylyltransferase
MDDLDSVILLVISIIMGCFLMILLSISITRRNDKKFLKFLWVNYFAWFIIIPPIIFPLLYNRLFFVGVFHIISLLCFREFSRITGLWHDKKYTIACYVALCIIYWPVYLGKSAYGAFQAFPIFAITAVLLIPVMRDEYMHMVQKTSLGMLGVAYFGWFLAHVPFLRNSNNGVELVFFLVLLAAVNNASAYLVGNLFGKHKLAPHLRPDRTFEGALVGLIVTVGISFSIKFLIPFVSVFHLILASAIISVGGTAGDLVISFIKRDLGIKGAGESIPIYGGILDRFDSLVFTAPLFFHFINNFYGIIH